MTTKATATRAEKKVFKILERFKANGLKKPTNLHITATDYDALEATKKLNSFGVELIRT